MIEISDAEIAFYKESLRKACRFDGRNLCDFRPLSLVEDSLLFPNALYGVRISIPDSKTCLMLAINADIVETKFSEEGTPVDDTYIEIELHSSASKYSRESAAAAQAATLREIKDLIQKFVIRNIDVRRLKLYEDKLHWRVQCDIYIVGQLYLSDVDHIFKGLRACFANCRFPRVAVSFNSWSEEYSYEILGTDEQLFARDALPLVFVVGEIEGKVVMDLSREELRAVDSYYILALSSEGDIVDIEKLDGNPVAINKLGSIVSKLTGLAGSLINI